MIHFYKRSYIRNNAEMDRLLEEARKKEEEKAKEMVMMVRVETFRTMQQDIVQLKVIMTSLN